MVGAKMKDSKEIKATVCLPNEVSAKFIGESKTVLNEVVSEYARRLVSEAESEERLQIGATKTVEITAQIVESAKWQLIHKMRRKAKHAGWLLTFQILMGLLTIPIGIGASNFGERWGLILCLVCAFAYLSILIIHLVLSNAK